MSERELSVASWLVRYRNQVRRAALLAAASFGVLIWGLIGARIIQTELMEQSSRAARARLLTAPLIPLAASHLAANPVPLAISPPIETRTGAFVTIDNKNADWIERLSYTLKKRDEKKKKK